MAKRRIETMPDSKYNDYLIGKLVNNVMLAGKKNVAERVVYKAIESIAEEKKESPADVFLEIVDNVCPKVMIKATRIGGATYQVPTEVSVEKGRSIAIKWIVNAARKRSEKRMAQRLEEEMRSSMKKEGNAYNKKVEALKMAEANKAFAQFSW
ncbi:MAG: 30S ribosomal protein S7 [bacterium]